MNLDTPMPGDAPAKNLSQKQELPTTFSITELQQLREQIRQISLYPAGSPYAEYLRFIKEGSDDLLAGKVNEATARQNVQKMLSKMGYTPDKHFGSEADNLIAPAEKGSLLDLSSDLRIKLMLQMNTRLASNVGYMRSGLTADALDQYPAWELVRVYSCEHPRDWGERWIHSGGELIEGRMIALKTDPIWKKLGRTELFPDGTDNECPPYAWGSGMGLRSISRRECVALKMNLPDRDLSFVPVATRSLADMTADRAELLAAWESLTGKTALRSNAEREELECTSEYERQNRQESQTRSEKDAMFRLLAEVETVLRETELARDGPRWAWLCDSLSRLTTTPHFDRYPNWRARAWILCAKMYCTAGIPIDELACLKRALELNPELPVKRRIKTLDRQLQNSEIP